MTLNHNYSFVSLLTLLFLSFTVLSQNSRIDSLKEILEKGTKDSIMVNTLIELSNMAIQDDDLNGFLKYSQENHYKTAIVGTQETNEKALSLYKKMGFKLKQGFYSFHKHNE